MVRDLLEDAYIIIPLEVSPGDLGLKGVNRDRVYIFCCHRTRCRYLYNIENAYAEISRTLKKYIHTEPQHYCVATAAQIRSDAMRVAKTRNKPFRFDTLHN